MRQQQWEEKKQLEAREIGYFTVTDTTMESEREGVDCRGRE